MTTAERNNERATLDEFTTALGQACEDAQDAGIPAESVARLLITTGILGALEAGVPRSGNHDIRRYMEHLTDAALDALGKAEKEAG
jgi:hypothetical protein